MKFRTGAEVFTACRVEFWDKIMILSRFADHRIKNGLLRIDLLNYMIFKYLEVES